MLLKLAGHEIMTDKGRCNVVLNGMDQPLPLDPLKD